MSERLLVAAAALCWMAALTRVPALLPARGSVAARPLGLSLLTLAMGLSVQVPAIYSAVGAQAGVPNIAVLLGHILVLVAAWAARCVLLLAVEPPPVARTRAARRLTATAAAAVLMAVLFGLAPIEQETLEFARMYGAEPYVVSYFVIFLTCLGLATFDIARLCRRFARRAPTGAVRTGLHFISAAGAVGVLYVAYKALFLLDAYGGYGLGLGSEQQVSRALLALGVALLVPGVALPAWRPYGLVHQLRAWRSSAASHSRLQPLWRDLTSACPEVLLRRPRNAGFAVPVLHPRARRDRLVIEILDARLKLRTYVDPVEMSLARARARQAGLSPADTEATAEAAGLAAAVARYRSHSKPREGSCLAPPYGGRNRAADVAWLERVAGHYRHSALVRQARVEATEENALHGR